MLLAVRAATETEKEVDIDAVLKDLQTKVRKSQLVVIAAC